jgi:hypothetical protein
MRTSFAQTGQAVSAESADITAVLPAAFIVLVGTNLQPPVRLDFFTNTFWGSPDHFCDSFQCNVRNIQIGFNAFSLFEGEVMIVSVRHIIDSFSVSDSTYSSETV